MKNSFDVLGVHIVLTNECDISKKNIMVMKFFNILMVVKA